MAKNKGFRQNDAESWSENPLDEGIDRRVNDKSVQDAIENKVIPTIDESSALGMTRSSGLYEGETFDKIVCEDVNGSKLIEYSLDDICQFQIELSSTGTGFVISRRVCEFNLLQENGDKLLKEDGDSLRTEGLVP